MQCSGSIHPEADWRIEPNLGADMGDLIMQEEETTSTGVRELSRWHSNSCISEGQAAVELFFRLNHARQTVDYVRRQVPVSLLTNISTSCSLHRKLRRKV